MPLYKYGERYQSSLMKLKPINRNSTAVSGVVRLLLSNDSRRLATFLNRSNTSLFIDCFSLVSADNHLVELKPGDYYEAGLIAGAEFFGTWETESDLQGIALVREFVEVT